MCTENRRNSNIKPVYERIKNERIKVKGERRVLSYL